MKPILLVFLLSLSALSLGRPHPAQAENTDSLWTQATQELAKGNHEAALVQLELFLQTKPESTYRDEVLFLSATLYEEKTQNLIRAKELYQFLVLEFPDSRSSIAANKRLRRLQKTLGDNNRGAKPQAKFTQLLNQFSKRPPLESLAEAEQLLLQYPNWPSRYQLRLWIARINKEKGTWRNALTHLRIVQSKGSINENIEATISIAEIQNLQKQFEASTASLNSVRKSPSLTPAKRQAISDIDRQITNSRLRARLQTISIALGLGSILFFLILLRRENQSWAASFSKLKKPPSEVFYILPFVTLFVFMALTGHQEAGFAITYIAIGGLLISWLCGSVLREQIPLRLPTALFCILLTLTASSSLCYLALQKAQLLDLVSATLVQGPDL